MKPINSSVSSFTNDERAIEGLPIRLVIALVVGVASLAIMMNMLGGIGELGETEVTVELSEEVVDIDGETTLSVVEENGDPVNGATVTVHSGSASLADGPVRLDFPDDDNEMTLDLGSGGHSDVTLRSDQSSGTLEIQVHPPSDSNYEDSGSNPEITVLE